MQLSSCLERLQQEWQQQMCSMDVVFQHCCLASGTHQLQGPLGREQHMMHRRWYWSIGWQLGCRQTEIWNLYFTITTFYLGTYECSVVSCAIQVSGYNSSGFRGQESKKNWNECNHDAESSYNSLLKLSRKVKIPSIGPLFIPKLRSKTIMAEFEQMLSLTLARRCEFKE